MKRFGVQVALVGTLLIVLGIGSYAIAGGGSGNLRADRLIGFEEVPAVSSVASGSFRATLDRDANTINYVLRYSALEGDVLQSHIHFGQRDVNGGITLFLCSNLGNGPAGTPACPAGPAEVADSLSSAELANGAAAQGITNTGDAAADAAEWDEIERAIRAGKTYVNVHSSKFTGGEIRAQINSRGNDDD